VTSSLNINSNSVPGICFPFCIRDLHESLQFTSPLRRSGAHADHSEFISGCVAELLKLSSFSLSSRTFFEVTKAFENVKVDAKFKLKSFVDVLIFGFHRDVF